MSKPVHAIPLPKWPFVALALLVIAGAVTFVVTRGDGSAAAKGSTIEKTSVAQPADGCLGGPDAAKAILVAQKTAPPTADGAAAFLATYLRWQGRTPQPDEPDPKKIGQAVWGPKIPAEIRKEAIERSSGPGFHFTVKDKRYSIRDVTGDRVRIAMAVDIANDESDVTGGEGGTIAWVRRAGNAWKFDGEDLAAVKEATAADEGAAFRARLAEQGTALRGGC